MMIIDTHQHLWDLDRVRLAWLTQPGPLGRSFLMDDYLRAAEGLGIVKTIYMEVDVEPEYLEVEAEYVLNLCGRGGNPMAAAVIGGRPASPGVHAYVDRFAASPYVKGVRQGLHENRTPAGKWPPE